MRYSKDSVGGNGGGSDNASFPSVPNLLYFSSDGIATVMILWCVMYITDITNSCGDL